MAATVEVMSLRRKRGQFTFLPLLPTPGIVFRHLQKRMNCCRCAPLTVSVIYNSMDRLEHDTRVCPYSLAEARRKLAILQSRRDRRERVNYGDYDAVAHAV